MSFVGSPYRHDVFVSYSHGDVVRDGQSLLKQWSQGFVRELERELQFEMNAAISLFLDESERSGRGVDRMAPLSDSLKTELGASAILAVLMTPQYLSSDWCRQELDWWIDTQRQYGIPHDNRMAVARVLPTGTAEWPEPLTDNAGHQLVGVHLFDRAAEAATRPYGWPIVSGTTGGEFRNAVIAYAGLIQSRLREVKKALDIRRKQEADRASIAAASGQVLYLHGRNDQTEAWKRVQSELEGDGYAVLPLEPEPVESDPKAIKRAREKRIDGMSGCDAVLLLGTEDVRALGADLAVIGRLERELAKARFERLLPCSVVDTVGVIRTRFC